MSQSIVEYGNYLETITIIVSHENLGLQLAVCSLPCHLQW